MKVIQKDGITIMDMTANEKQIVQQALNDNDTALLFTDYPVLADRRWIKSSWTKGRWKYRPTAWLTMSLRDS